MSEQTPVQELRAAAAKLRETAARAHYVKGRWFVDVAGPVASTSWLGPSHDVLTATWPQAAWAALMHPRLAEPLAAWLDSVAAGIADHDPVEDGCHCVAEDSYHSAIKVARALLGGEQS